MEITLFSFTKYKDYLNKKISHMPKSGRGVKKKLAEYVRCQTAYISHILNGDVNFNLDQAVKVNQFFGHSEEESRYFLLMVQLARAATKDLEDYCLREMKKVNELRADLKARFNIDSEISEKDQHIYYSSWIYSAIHIMTSIPHFNSTNSIADHLKLNLKIVREALNFLCQIKLVEETKKGFQIGNNQLYISSGSIQIRRHHLNWRNHSQFAIDTPKQDDFHFSSVYSLSREDASKVKEIITQSIENSRKIIRESKEEEVHILNIDFYQL